MSNRDDGEPLEPPDMHHVRAAQGWLDLRNAAEARAELRRVSPPNRNHPEVLESLWQAWAMERNWGEALAVSEILVRVAPGVPTGWINYSYSLHELRRTPEAVAGLLPVVDQFPEVSTIPYNLACYLCQLGKIGEAREWLVRAIRILGKEPIKRLALADADLRQMWDEIEAM